MTSLLLGCSFVQGNRFPVPSHQPNNSYPQPSPSYPAPHGQFYPPNSNSNGYASAHNSHAYPKQSPSYSHHNQPYPLPPHRVEGDRNSSLYSDADSLRRSAYPTPQPSMREQQPHHMTSHTPTPLPSRQSSMQRPNQLQHYPGNSGYSNQPPHRQRTPDDGYGTMDDNLDHRNDVMTSQQGSMRMNDARNLNTRYPRDSNTDLYSERSIDVPKHSNFRSRDDESVSDEGGFGRASTMQRYSAANNLTR